MSSHRLPKDWVSAPWTIADPGASGTFNLENKGRVYCPIVTATSESRTIPAPDVAGQVCIVSLKTDGGNATITITGGQGVSSVVLDDAGDFFCLESIDVGGTAKWAPAFSNGPLSGFTEVFSNLLITDDGLLRLGDTGDQVLVNSASGQTANTALTNALIGTPALATVPANSLIVSNVTADGDQVFVTVPASGSNSIEWLRNDASAGLTVFNEASGDIDFRIESNVLSSFLTIDGNACLNGQIAFGGAVPTNPQAFFAILPAVNASGVTTNQSYFHATVLPGAAVTIPAGTAPVVASLNIHEPNITATGTVTDAATVRIVDAPTEGGTNWAFWVDAGATRFDGTCYIGDTSNATVTLGLTLNQAANDDAIFEVKSSDVSHAGTGITEADTYGTISKWVANNGGLFIQGIDDTADQGVVIRGVGSTATATRSTAGTGPIMLSGSLISATNAASCGADKNLLVVRDLNTTRFVMDSDGDSFQDVGTAWTNFDEHDDLTLLNSLSSHLARPGNAIGDAFGGWLKANKPQLEALKLVSFNEDTDSRPFVNMSKLSMLLVGAVRQVGLELQGMKENALARIEALEAKMLPGTP